MLRAPRHSACSGNNITEVSDALFGLLCSLERFDLSGNHIDQQTLVGWLAHNLRNLKDQTRINASYKGLRGESTVQHLGTKTT